MTVPNHGLAVPARPAIAELATGDPVEPPPPRRRGALAGLLSATGASTAANAMVAVLVPWLVLIRSGSAAQAGLVGAVTLAAGVVALFLGGPLIDRWGRRRVSAGADLLSALAVLALPLVDAVVGLTLVSVLILVALGAAFDGPGAAAREAARPDVAAAGRVPVERVNARGEAVEGAGGIAGPALAGAGLGLIGAMSSLWVAAGLFVLAAVATWLALPPDRPRTVASQPYLREAADGLRLVWHDRTLRAIALLGTFGLLAVAPFTLVLTAHFAPRGEAAALGLVSAALATGAVVGALAYGAVAQRLRRRTVLLGSLVSATVGFVAMAALPPAPLLGVLAGLTGVAIGPINPVLAVLMQERTEPGIRGRVVSTTWSLSMLASPLGVLAAGLLLEVSSPAVALLVVGAGVALTTVYTALTPGLRDVETHRKDRP